MSLIVFDSSLLRGSLGHKNNVLLIYVLSVVYIIL